MQLSRLLLAAVLCLFGYLANAQTNTFPVTGNFRVQADPDMTPMRFNKVVISPESLIVLKDDMEFQRFRITSVSDMGIDVEQYFEGEDPNVPRDRRRFMIQLDQITGSDCYVTLLYPELTEKLHLVRTE